MSGDSLGREHGVRPESIPGRIERGRRAILAPRRRADVVSLRSATGRIRPAWALIAALIMVMCCVVAWGLGRTDHGSRARADSGPGATPIPGAQTNRPEAAESPTGDPAGGAPEWEGPRLIVDIDGRPTLTDHRGKDGPMVGIGVRDIRIEAISPDAARVAGRVPADDGKPGTALRVESLDGSNPVDFAPEYGAYTEPEFSLDGRTLFFTNTADPNGVPHFGARIMSAPVDGKSAPRQLFEDAEEFCDSSFSASRVGLYSFSRSRKGEDFLPQPDGITRCDSVNGGIALYNERDGSVTDVPRPENLPPANPTSDISPDGKRIALVSILTHAIRLYVLDPGAAEATLIPGNATWGGGLGGYDPPIADWSLDGRLIAIDLRDGPGGSRTVTYDSETGEETAAWPLNSRRPVWQPERTS
jgi:hypothetical protein